MADATTTTPPTSSQGTTNMDPSVTNALSAAFGLSALRESNEQTLRIGRQSDGAAADMRSIGAGVFRLIAEASDPTTYADYQTASHVPTSQPYVAPNFVSPAGTTVPKGS